MGMLDAFRSESRFLYLLLSMVAFILIRVSLPHLFVLDVAFVVILVATLRAVSGHRVIVIVVVGLVVAFWAASALRAAIGPSVWISLFGDLLVASFMVTVAVVILRDVLQHAAVTFDKIYGSVCSYLLLAIAWAFLYEAVELVVPGAFSFPAGELQHEGRKSMVYFSFVTLSTLGYGDIAPVHPLARALCWMEAVFGQIYLAVLVAGLVGMHLSSKSRG